MTLHLAPHETGHIASGDLRLHYRHFRAAGGTSKKLPVLAVHGLSYFSYDWIGVAAELARGRDVVALDQRGFGGSDWSASRDYGLRTLSADLVHVMDALGWERAALVGHSMGGRVCLCTAAWAPERVGALVCVDFAPDVAAAGRRKVAQRIGQQPDRFESVDAALAYHGHPDEPMDSPLRARYTAFLRQQEDGYVLLRDLHYRDNFRDTLRTGTSAPIGVDLWAMVAGLEAPSLFIRGSESDMFAPETMDKIRQVQPKAQVLELPGSHDLVGDNPTGLTQAITSFLSAC